MANIITDVSGDKVVRMTNARFARLPAAALFSGWSSIRIALYLRILDSGVNITGTPRFSVGLCSGTSNIPGDTTPNHAVGVITNNATLTRSTSPTRYGLLNAIVGAKYVSGSLTTGSALSTSASANWHTTGTPSMLFVDIVKGSPNYTIKLFYYTQSATVPVPTLSDFVTQSTQGVPSFTNHTYNSTGVTVAVDEGTDGVLDAAYVWWNQANPSMDIHAWRVYRLS